MLWFKHAGAFRNSPAMKLIHRRHGPFGTAAAYRLLEVMTERYGADGDFSATLTLASPFTENWLETELLGEERNDSLWQPPELADLLSTFDEAGLIVFDSVTGPGWVSGPDGERVERESVNFLRIHMPNLRSQADEYTARRASKSLVTPV